MPSALARAEQPHRLAEALGIELTTAISFSALVTSWADRLHLPIRIGYPESQDPRVAEAIGVLADWGLESQLYGSGTGEFDQPAQKSALTSALRDLSVGTVDAVVAGAVLPTAVVVRESLKAIGLLPETSFASSCFLLELVDGRVLAYADCGIVPEPDSKQLAEIAIQTAATFTELVCLEPRVAMLSFSTRGSASHKCVAKVAEAVDIAQDLRPDLAVDGEFQFDAALVPEVAARKAPGSSVAGQANVFIFPSLDSANIAYKITQRLGHALAIGPLIQGLSAPVHDLSRGAVASDIVAVSMAAAIQAQRRVACPR